MEACEPHPRPDMYGLGIRFTFYMQWFSALYFNHIGQEVLPAVRLLGLCLSIAATTALLIQISRLDSTDSETSGIPSAMAPAPLDPAGIYIVLLLSTGTYMFLVPVYLFRPVTCWNPRYNPLSWSKERQVRVFRLTEWALVVTAASTAVWFFTTHVPGLHREGRCHQYGFLFSPMPLDGNAGFLAFNAAVYLLMLLVCLGKALWRVFCDRRVSERTRHERGDLRLPQGLIDALSRVQLLSDLTVFSVLIVAVELSIQWNEISGVNELDTVAQLVPPLIAASVMLRAVHQLLSLRQGDSEADGRAAQSPVLEFDVVVVRRRVSLDGEVQRREIREGLGAGVGAGAPAQGSPRAASPSQAGIGHWLRW
ncbi:hypothetical protein PLIIFM63780_010353 [Purpureocillium lilacinum]|nr:hypothetical protein PLIIFM63780_010353 [Purpureocillium lilacinum]